MFGFFRNLLNQFSYRRQREFGFTTIELMVSLGLFAIVTLFVIIGGARLFDRQAEIRATTLNYQHYEQARTRISNILKQALYVTEVPSSAINANCFGLDGDCYGVSSTEGVQGCLNQSSNPSCQTGTSDILTVFAKAVPDQDSSSSLQPALRHVDVLNQTQIQFTQSGIPQHPTLPQNSYLYLSYSTDSQKFSQIVEVTGVAGGTMTINPSLSSNLPYQGIVGVEADRFTFKMINNNGTTILQMIKGDLSHPKLTETLLSNINQFQVSYQLMNKSDYGIGGDPCQSDSKYHRETSTDWQPKEVNPASANSMSCTLNNMTGIEVSSNFVLTKIGRGKNANDGLSFHVSPAYYNPTKSGANDQCAPGDPTCKQVACDQNIIPDQCLDACNYDNPDYKPGSNYCKCIFGGTGVNTSTTLQNYYNDNVIAETIAADGDRWSACCAYRDELIAKGGDTYQNHCYYFCTAAPRTDNPDLKMCNPQFCGREFPNRACIWPKMTAVWPANSATVKVGSTNEPITPGAASICAADSTYIFDLQTWIGTTTNASTPDTDAKLNTSGHAIRYDGELQARIPATFSNPQYVNWKDSPGCACFDQIFPLGTATTFTIPATTLAVYHSLYPTTTSDSWNGTFSYPIAPATLGASTGTSWSTGASDANVVITPFYGQDIEQTQVTTGTTTQNIPGYGLRSCWDPRWTSAGNACYFRAHYDGAKNTNAIDEAPWDTLGHAGYAELGLPGFVDGDQKWMNQCACELAGMPVDPVKSANAVFGVTPPMGGFGTPPANAYRAGLSPTFYDDVPGGRCACFDPAHAANSTVNAGMNYNAIKALCPGGSNSSTTPGGSGT